VELRALTPRRVRVRPGRGVNVFINRVWAVVVFVAAAPILYVCVGEPMFLRFGSVIPAIVTGHSAEKDGRGRVFFHVEYSYTFGGSVQDRSEEVNLPTFNSMSVGRAIELRGVAMGPVRIVLLPGKFYFGDHFFWYLGMLLDGALILGWWWTCVVPRRLIRIGEPVIGKIIGKKNVQDSRSVSYLVQYSYEDREGQTFKREIDVGMVIYEAATEGDEVVVLYDPKKSTRAIVYDYSNFMAG
jgi:hypothetical protein